MSEKKGDCFFTALQFIHAVGAEPDPIQVVFNERDINLDKVDVVETIKLVHGMVRNTKKSKPMRHAWVEVNGFVIDGANDCRLVEPIRAYYKRFFVHNFQRFSRPQVFQILMAGFPVGYWVDIYTAETKKKIQVYDVSMYPGMNRNFLEEYGNLKV